MANLPFSEESFPNVPSELPLIQFHPISSCPVTGHQREIIISCFPAPLEGVWCSWTEAPKHGLEEGLQQCSGMGQSLLSQLVMLCLVPHRAQLALLAARAHLMHIGLAINPTPRSLCLGNVGNNSVSSVLWVCWHSCAHCCGCAALREGPSLQLALGWQLFPLGLCLGSCFTCGGCRAGRDQGLLRVGTIPHWWNWQSCSALPAS